MSLVNDMLPVRPARQLRYSCHRQCRQRINVNRTKHEYYLSTLGCITDCLTERKPEFAFRRHMHPVIVGASSGSNTFAVWVLRMNNDALDSVDQFDRSVVAASHGLRGLA